MFPSNRSTRARALAQVRFSHGMFNWPYVLTDAQIEARILRETGYVLKLAALPQNAGACGRIEAERPAPGYNPRHRVHSSRLVVEVCTTLPEAGGLTDCD
jgi:hypothetical protein